MDSSAESQTKNEHRDDGSENRHLAQPKSKLSSVHADSVY